MKPRFLTLLVGCSLVAAIMMSSCSVNVARREYFGYRPVYAAAPAPQTAQQLNEQNVNVLPNDSAQQNAQWQNPLAGQSQQGVPSAPVVYVPVITPWYDVSYSAAVGAYWSPRRSSFLSFGGSSWGMSLGWGSSWNSWDYYSPSWSFGGGYSCPSYRYNPFFGNAYGFPRYDTWSGYPRNTVVNSYNNYYNNYYNGSNGGTQAVAPQQRFRDFGVQRPYNNGNAPSQLPPNVVNINNQPTGANPSGQSRIPTYTVGTQLGSGTRKQAFPQGNNTTPDNAASILEARNGASSIMPVKPMNPYNPSGGARNRHDGNANAGANMGVNNGSVQQDMYRQEQAQRQQDMQRQVQALARQQEQQRQSQALARQQEQMQHQQERQVQAGGWFNGNNGGGASRQQERQESRQETRQPERQSEMRGGGFGTATGSSSPKQSNEHSQPQSNPNSNSQSTGGRIR